MKKLSFMLALCMLVPLLCIAIGADTFNGTMVRSSTADPNLFFYNGKYYLTQTGTSRIAVFETSKISELGTKSLTSNISYKAFLNGVVYDPTVTELFGEGAEINGTWSPEIHYFSETDFPGHPEYEGWYMLVGLRKTYMVNGSANSSYVRLVVLKSTTDSPKGPYGHPTTGVLNHSQAVLNAKGEIHDDWACGQTILRIPEGEYAGLYGMWVSEEGRGLSGTEGKFYQKIMIAKMQSPWQFSSEVGVVTTPTQAWEYTGSSSTKPRVVEGATPVYGKNGEVFITYSGSGYWSTYGLGQLTWNGGNPLETSSWVKYKNNPIFSAKTAENLRGAGHASFFTDTSGNGFFCYHAYKYDKDTATKASSRDAYIEPYYIDYTMDNGVGKGVIRPGINDNGVPANYNTSVSFDASGSYLTPPSVATAADRDITLNLSEKNAEGYLIYRSTNGEIFDYVTTVSGSEYTDTDVSYGTNYYYRAYAYREEEIGDVSETVSATPLRTRVDGDLNFDNRTSLADVMRIMRLSSDEDADVVKIAADYNLDGDVTLADALALLRDILR